MVKLPSCLNIVLLTVEIWVDRLRVGLPYVIILRDIANGKGALYFTLSYDVASESEIRPCNKIDKPLVVYRFPGNVMTSITTLHTCT